MLSSLGVLILVEFRPTSSLFKAAIVEFNGEEDTAVWRISIAIELAAAVSACWESSSKCKTCLLSSPFSTLCLLEELLDARFGPC